MPSQDSISYFRSKLEEHKKVFKDELNVLAMSSKDIVNGFDFQDEELVSALGKESYEDADQMYSEILRVVRNNPLNKKQVPKGFHQYMRPILHGKL